MMSLRVMRLPVTLLLLILKYEVVRRSNGLLLGHHLSCTIILMSLLPIVKVGC